MANKFKFQLLTGANPQVQYDAITTPDALTFYLLKDGIGYLGATPLFGGGAQKVIVMTTGTLVAPVQDKLYVLYGVTYNAQTKTGLYFYNGTNLVSYSDELFANYLASLLMTSMTEEGYTGNNETIATTKAVVDFVNQKLTAGNIVNAEFFRAVSSHTLTEADLANVNIIKPEGVGAGEIGLLFTADTDATAGGETYFFISLKDYIDVYTCSSTNSIEMVLNTSTNTFSANLKIKATEQSVLIDETTGGVYLNKATTINDTTPSSNALITEASIVQYIQTVLMPAVTTTINQALADVITYEESV